MVNVISHTKKNHARHLWSNSQQTIGPVLKKCFAFLTLRKPSLLTRLNYRSKQQRLKSSTFAVVANSKHVTFDITS